MKSDHFMSRDAPKSDLIAVYEEILIGKKLVAMHNFEKNLGIKQVVSGRDSGR